MLRTGERLIIKRTHSSLILFNDKEATMIIIEPRDYDKDDVFFELKGEQEILKLYNELGKILGYPTMKGL